MDRYDANPFADPNVDPFSDKGISQAREGHRAAADTLDTFNPFADDQFVRQQPAVLPTASEPPPYSVSSSTSAAVSAAADDLRRRQEELDRKAAELERRERDMQRNSQTEARMNNFPPLPKCCPVKPCFYQDFVVDIPTEFHVIVKATYYTWIAYTCLLFLNIFACLTYFIATISAQTISNQSGLSFGLSILYFILWTPLSFVCWYRPAYNAFRNDSSFYFFVFFFIFFLQCCACIIQCLGIEGSGTVGWLSGLWMINSNVGVGAFMLTIGALFSALAAVCVILLIRIHRFYRTSGASFRKAQEEFAQGVVTNRAVQQTAAGVASAAARGAVDQYSGNYDNRY